VSHNAHLWPIREVKSNNPEILINNPRIWFNLKYIELENTFKYDLNWIKQMNMKMRKLTSIKLNWKHFILCHEKISSVENTSYSAMLNIAESVPSNSRNSIIIQYNGSTRHWPSSAELPKFPELSPDGITPNFQQFRNRMELPEFRLHSIPGIPHRNYFPPSLSLIYCRWFHR
jgi:hypothetical protein